MKTLIIPETFDEWLVPLSDEFTEWKIRDKEIRKSLYIFYLFSKTSIEI